MDRDRFRRESSRALERRDYAALVNLCRDARRSDADFADPWFLESVAAEAGGRLDAALLLVDEALQREPDNVEYLVQKARYHIQGNQAAQASTAAERALSMGVDTALLLDTLGVVFTRLGDHGRAAALLRRAVAAAPERPQFHFNLAAAEQFLGNTEAARESYEAVIRLVPAHARSYWALSELEKNAVSERHEAAMRRLAAAPGLGSTDALYLAHALARIEEQRGEYGAAIERLRRAKAARRKSLDYRYERDGAMFAALRRHRAQAAPAPAGEGAAPLFVVGMPRTGTTLVERILTAHASVESFGEQQALPNAVKRLSTDRGRSVMSAAVLEGYTARPGDLQRLYREQLAPMLASLEPPTRYFIDKMPLNALYAGMILDQVAGAKVVMLRRHPMDAGLSNFRQLFSLEYSYYNYAYDLGDTGRYVADFGGLMEHWRREYGARLHVLDYEALVEHPEPQVRALLEYLELPWDPACLTFHEQQGAVATPSGMQVRQPIYRDALGRWKRYGAALDPLREALETAGLPVPAR